MGRTVAPFSHVLEEEERALGKFKRALRKEDQEAFDRIFSAGKRHVPASVYASHPWPMDLIFLSVLVEQQKLIERLTPLRTEFELLRDEVEALRNEVNRLKIHERD